MEVIVTFTVNGRERTVTTEGGRSLLEVLREEFEVVGVK